MIRFFYSYIPIGDTGRNLNNDLREWCFVNLRRPAFVNFYDRYGSFDRRAQLYRRRTKKLGRYGSWSTWVGNAIEVYYEIDFEDTVDQELFLINWLGEISLISKIPFEPNLW